VLADVMVRQALLHGLDRQSLTDVMTNGLSQVADSFYLPGEPLRSELESSIVKYPFDATRAAQLLTQAGWTRGADGVLVRGSDGQRMELDFWAREGATDKVAVIITDDWKRLGVVGAPYIIPAARRTDREYEAKRPGFLCCVRVGYDTFHSGKLHQRQIPTAATNWNGINYGGYVNPRADAIVDTLNSTLDPAARLPLERDLVHEYTANVAILPMWWEIFPILLVKGVNGPRPNFMSATANMFEWDRV
jgi:peptide/nickel transport system substrate-binding protein